MTHRISSTVQSGVRTIAGDAMAGWHFHLPAVVTSWSGSRVVVEPKVSRVDLNGVIVPFPPLMEVPIQYPAVGGIGLTFPVAVGSEGIVHVCDSDMDRFKQSGVAPAQAVTREHSPSDSVFVPGNISVAAWADFGTVPPLHLLLRHGAGMLALQEGKVALGAGPNELVQIMINSLTVLLTDYPALGTYITALTTIKGTLPTP